MQAPAAATSPIDVALCTICDRSFLPRLMVTVDSLRRHRPDAIMHVVCLDQPSQRCLEGRSGVAPVPLTALERLDPALRSLRGVRTHQRYAWTLKPVTCLHLLETVPTAEAVVFLDADLMFFGDAGPLFDELTRGSVLLVPERHLAPEAWSDAGTRGDLGAVHGSVRGFYNSGAIGFRRDADGLAALRWWRDQCLNFAEDGGGAGQQGYQWQLNSLPERFAGVRIIEHPGVGLAPWNARDARLELRDGTLHAGGQPLVFYHYQSLGLRLDQGLARLARWCGNDLGALPGVLPQTRATIARHWRITHAERELLWRPYRLELAAAVAELIRLDPGWRRCIPNDPGAEIGADVLWDLRWRAYRAAGRILPLAVRRLASSLRARVRRSLTSPV